MKARSSSRHSAAPSGLSSGALPIFFEHFPDPVLIWDWKSGDILSVNHAAETVLGYSADDLRWMEFISMLPDGMLDRLPSILRDEQKNAGLDVCTTLRCKTGKSLPVEMRTRLIHYGESILRCMVIRDISEGGPGAAEERLEDDPPSLPRLFEEQEMVFELSGEGFFTAVNAICLQKTGYTRRDLSDGIHFVRIILPEERERALRDFDRLCRGEHLDALEYTVRSKNGASLPVILSLSPVSVEGEVRGVRGVALDITEHRRIEHELVIREKLNMLGELAGGVVHNFNNILAVILGYLDILPTENLDENGERIIQNIRRAALDGTDIVRRIQNFSTPTETSPIEPSDLNGIVQEVLEFMKPRYAAPVPRIVVDVRLQPVPPVRVIPFEMREVLSNIIINAFDAMPEGGSLSVSTEVRGGFAALTVADTGTGMSEETRRRLFEPFFTTKGKKGTGIGMSVSFAIIGKFGGEIQVDSALGRGTRVTILLPCAPNPPAAEPPAAGAECAPGACSILVVDDEANICEILDEFLSRAGHRVVTAHGSEKGLALLRERCFDILITDLNMPGVSGWEVARLVRGMSPETCIIMLTGWGTRIEEINRDERVVDHLLIKPISFSALSEVIGRAARRK